MYVFKFANQEPEIEQIHRLNYAAFVEEIPQHAPNPERRLVDQFHAENTYAIALEGEEVVAMLALRSNRPFSLDRKLADLDSYLPPHDSLCEIRLLYVQPNHRNGKIMKGMMEMIAHYAVTHGHEMALISGTTRQQRFYKHLGFVAFGPLVGSGDALFQPMYLTVGEAKRQTPWVQALYGPAKNGDAKNGDVKNDDTKNDVNTHAMPLYEPPINYLPGPVNIPATVMEAMSRPMVSHRNAKFLDDVAALQARLCEQVGASYVEFLFGSGTLANEAIAAQLARLPGRGLILVNGEFGHRLEGMARRWQLSFTSLAIAWGETFALETVDAYLSDHADVEWVWCVHSETSTGILNDLQGLATVCRARSVKFCIDCISSLGVVPIDLSQTYLAAATSGKALGAVTGLAMVFYNQPISPAPEQVPSYLDLGSYRKAQGVPFTVNANLVYALHTALDAFANRSFRMIAQDGATLRKAVRELGLQVLAPEAVASPAVTTIALPAHVASAAVGDALAAHGFLISYQSRYLVEQNWIQICLMGEYRMDALPDLLRVLGHLVASPERMAA